MKAKILLVEDDAWLAQLYTDAVQLEGSMLVVGANNAAAALTMLDEETDIQLILLDMFLPGHNGIELLHELVSYSDVNTIPVIVLSSVPQRDFAMSAERWRHYGVKQYLYKPAIKPKQLVVVLKEELAKAVAL